MALKRRSKLVGAIGKSPIVLVHGAFHGGWCWGPVGRRLRMLGHEVFAPTQTGLGERSHLLAAATGIEVFVRDILNVAEFEGLTDVVLVGHSFGGRIVTGVADAAPERVRRLIYIDGGLPVAGVSRLDSLAPDEREARLRAAAEHDGGLSVPAPPATRFDVDDPEIASWMERRLTPQPLAVERTPLQLVHPIGAGRPATYIRCVRPPLALTEPSAAYARGRPDWRYVEFEGGHSAIMTHPIEIADLIAAEAAVEPEASYRSPVAD